VTISLLLRGFQTSAGTSDCSLDRRPKGIHKFINTIAYRANPCSISLVKALLYEPNDVDRGRKKHTQISEIKREKKPWEMPLSKQLFTTAFFSILTKGIMEMCTNI
jgi:hypothetical protein